MIKVKNVDPSIEFLWVGSQLTPGMGRVAADPGVGSQLIPVPWGALIIVFAVPEEDRVEL